MDADGSVVAIEEDVRDVEVSAAVRELPLWLYADRARALPKSFDELSAERIFPAGMSFGGYREVVVSIDGCEDARFGPEDANGADPLRGRVVHVPVCERASLPLRLHVRAVLELPERYGTLGHAGPSVSLGDPWYPLLLGANELRPVRGDHRVRFVSAEKRTLVTPSSVVEGTETRSSIDDATHLPLFALDGAHVHREVTRGVDVTFVTSREPMKNGAQRSDPLRDGDPFDPDAAGRIEAATIEAVKLLRRLGFVASSAPAPRAMAERLVVVEIQERERLASPLPGLVAVSDHAFHLLPIDLIDRFHATALQRQLFAALVAPHLRAIEARTDLAWTSDLDGSLLSDLALRAADRTADSPESLVGFAGFHPAVDQLLYAPHIAFPSAYFRYVEEPDRTRDEADRARTTEPLGHLVLEKLRDHLDAKELKQAIDLHLFHGEPWRRAVEMATGRSERWFFEQWLSRHHDVAYKLAGVRDERAGDAITHVVAIERSGETELREPVTVEIEDDRGTKARGVWDAPGARGEVRVTTKGSLRDATVDPDGRLPQMSDPRGNHPRFDDLLTHSWRPPVFNAFDVGTSSYAGSQRIAAVADFTVKRKYDVRESYGARVTSDARGTGGSIRYGRGLGELRDLNSTVDSLVFSASYLRASSGFGGAEVGANAGSVGVSYSHDTRVTAFDAATGSGISVGLGVGYARTFDGTSHPTLDVTFRGQALFWPDLRHIVALTYGATLTYCPALPQSLPALSGAGYFRGYEADELLGCGNAYVMLEERWALIRGLYVNAADLAWGRKLELVPFVGAGALTSKTSLTTLVKRPIFDAGLGLRAHYDYFGVQPGVLGVDVGIPVSRTDACARDDNGKCLYVRPGYGLYTSFTQTF